MKKVSIVTPCYNEETNIRAIYEEVIKVFSKVNKFVFYEYIFIDNASEDKTVEVLKELAKNDKRVKIIVNTRNFGHIRSPYHGMLQATGDAVIIVAADLQDPPELIHKFLDKWEEGYKVVVGVKKKSKESRLMFAVRRLFYGIINRLSEIGLITNFTGFGLYDKSVMDILREMNDPYPYFRGLVCEIGHKIARVEYIQPKREKGKTKNNFYTLYDAAMLGIVNHSKIPLRLATMLGFFMSILSLLVAVFYFSYKIIFWQNFSLGLAPLVIGLFLFSSIQMFFLGIIGEYIGTIHTQVIKRPLVIEKERINF